MLLGRSSIVVAREVLECRNEAKWVYRLPKLREISEPHKSQASKPVTCHPVVPVADSPVGEFVRVHIKLQEGTAIGDRPFASFDGMSIACMGGFLGYRKWPLI